LHRRAQAASGSMLRWARSGQCCDDQEFSEIRPQLPYHAGLINTPLPAHKPDTSLASYRDKDSRIASGERRRRGMTRSIIPRNTAVTWGDLDTPPVAPGVLKLSSVLLSHPQFLRCAVLDQEILAALRTG